MIEKDGWLKDPTPEEIDELVRGYSESQLRENAQIARRHPGTEWDSTLADEMARRGLDYES